MKVRAFIRHYRENKIPYKFPCERDETRPKLNTVNVASCNMGLHFFLTQSQSWPV